MKLSVIIPCKNGETHIKRCITSLVNQKLKLSDYEIIIIDDGSTDNSLEVIEELQKTYKNIIFYKQSSQGQGAARNKGIKLAKGDYIYFLDADDYLAYNSLNIILDYIENHHLDVVGFNTILTEDVNLFNQNTNFKIKEIYISSGLDYIIKNKNHRLEAWWYIIKKDYLINTKFRFEEGEFLEDVIFTKNILLSAKRFAFIPIDIHRYVKNPFSTMNNESQKNLTLLISGYVSLIYRLDNLKSDQQKTNNLKLNMINENIEYTSSLNTYFMFYKLIRADIQIKKINEILNKLQKIKAYPFKRHLIVEEYTHYKIRVSAIIFNNKYLFYFLLYPIRFLYRKKLIRLP